MSEIIGFNATGSGNATSVRCLGNRIYTATRGGVTYTYRTGGTSSDRYDITSLHFNLAASGAGNIRVAVYSADLATLYAQGNAEVAVSGNGWYQHASVTQYAQIPGATDLVIAISNDDINGKYGWATNYDGAASGDSKSSTTDYTGNFTAPLDIATSRTALVCAYAVVTLAAGGTPYTQSLDAAMTTFDVVNQKQTNKLFTAT